MVTAKRALELADIIAARSRAPVNVIDAPFDCVTTNLRPETLAEIAEALYAYAEAHTETR